jgi:histidinol dehydrogenase
MKRQSIAKLDKKLINRLAAPAATFADMEGLVEHAHSLRLRSS